MRYRRKYYFEPQTLADVIFLLLILNSGIAVSSTHLCVALFEGDSIRGAHPIK